MIAPAGNVILDHLIRAIPGAHSATWGGGGRRITAPRVSSRTPEGRYGRCPLCRNFIAIEPSEPFGDAPCPCCGHLICSIDPLWPVGPGDPPGARRKGTRMRPGPTLGHRLGRAVASGIRRLRRAVRATRGSAAPTSHSGSVWDYWLDG